MSQATALAQAERRNALRRSRQLVEALAARLQAELVETHISWVLLAADTAYKIKKPLRTPFLDYGSLAARLRCCREELRVNARLAPGLYRQVVAVTGTLAAPRIGGGGDVLDYAVQMRRFPSGALFSERLAEGTLQAADVDALADLMARAHADAPRAPPNGPWGTPRLRRASADAVLAAQSGNLAMAGRRAIREWLADAHEHLLVHWAARLAGGHVRECHGDLHLGNVVNLAGAVAAFDAIEFDPALRWIDVLDDAAFPVMDFTAHGRPDFAFRLLNRWLDATGEHEALAGLRHAAVYRSLVRALAQSMRRPRCRSAGRPYLDTAAEWMRQRPLQLTIMHGLPGSGKTFVAQQLLEAQQAIRLRSDVERKRLAGLPSLASSRTVGVNLYTPRHCARVYERLLELAGIALAAGFPVVLDAAFLRRADREAARQLAARLRAQFAIVRCEAPQPVLRARLAARGPDASEADAGVLQLLADRLEPLAPRELAWCQPVAAGRVPPG